MLAEILVLHPWFSPQPLVYQTLKVFFSVLFAVLDPWDSSLAVDLEDVVENGKKIFFESLCCAGNKKSLEWSVVPRKVSTGTLELKVQERFQTAEGRKEKIIE